MDVQALNSYAEKFAFQLWDSCTKIDEEPFRICYLQMYQNGLFKPQIFNASPRNIQANYRRIAPMEKSKWITAEKGTSLNRSFLLNTFSDVDKAYLRYATSAVAKCMLNDKEVKTVEMKDYSYADVTSLLKKENNSVSFSLPNDKALLAEIEILLKNGERIVWNSDATWTEDKGSKPVSVVKEMKKPTDFDKEEHLALYEIKAPRAVNGSEETRMYISYKGDVANLYKNGQLINDSFYDGTDWIISLSRLDEAIDENPLVMRINGLKSVDAPVYFEKNVNVEDCINPTITDIKVKREYRFNLK